MRSVSLGVRRKLGAAGLVTAGTLGMCVLAPSALAAPSGAPTQPAPIAFPGFAPATPTVTVVLTPSAASGVGAAPAASPDIVCTVTLSQIVHYSKPGDDISWHWPWSCEGGAVNLTGNQSLVRDGGAWMTGPVSASGKSSGNENIRYPDCVNGTWQGQASGTFTRVGYTPSSWEGASPARDITSC